MPLNNETLYSEAEKAKLAGIEEGADVTDLANINSSISGGFLNLGGATTLTISSGAVTATKSFCKIDTEAASASDDLDTINGGTTGDILFIHPVADAHNIVVKHNTGNILTSTNTDITLDFQKNPLMFFFTGTYWIMIGGRY